MKKIIYFYFLPVCLAITIASFFLWDTQSYLQESLILLFLLIYLLLRSIKDKIKIGIFFLSFLLLIAIFYITVASLSYCKFDYSCYQEHSQKG